MLTVICIFTSNVRLGVQTSPAQRRYKYSADELGKYFNYEVSNRAQLLKLMEIVGVAYWPSRRER